MGTPVLKHKVIGIIGSRRRNKYEDYKAILACFEEVYEEGDWICSGGCPQGGDAMAETIGRQKGIPLLLFPPDWKRYGKSAGFVRNKTIAEHSDVLIACVHLSRTGGTEHTIKCFLTEGKTEVHLV